MEERDVQLPEIQYDSDNERLAGVNGTCRACTRKLWSRHDVANRARWRPLRRRLHLHLHLPKVSRLSHLVTSIPGATRKGRYRHHFVDGYLH
jgi:hypothetical protein